MTWNYRIVQFEEENGPIFLIQEVYYNKDHSLDGYCELSIVGDTVLELRSVLEMIAQALDRPILKESDFQPHSCIA
jgi:hypothetical protein